MATGRTVLKHIRVYVAGYDLSGYTRSPGPLVWQYDEADLTGIEEIKGYLPDKATVTPSALNGILDNTDTVGLHEIIKTPGSSRVVMIPVGIRTAPAQGDPVFVGQYQQQTYMLEGDTAAYINATFDEWDAAGMIAYDNPWGVLLHAKSAVTAVNSATGVDDNGASTTQGGYMVYQVFAGDGTATILTQHASTNSDGSFAALSGATTGVIDCSSPTAGIVAISKTATVNRYLRWQITLGTATTVTFALGFVREKRNFT